MIIRKCLEDISADFVPDMTTCLLKVREDSQGFLLPVLLEFVAACWRNLEMDLKLNIRFFFMLCFIYPVHFIHFGTNDHRENRIVSCLYSLKRLLT